MKHSFWFVLQENIKIIHLKIKIFFAQKIITDYFNSFLNL